ncbi:DUF6382 domain-containing protein [Clostridium sp. HBUAS56017]|uniref:DUF6382 domain-containing protein n=1 Tax=Clostridium sp. HBUAS56017 TaxID=2571128 RepID=UPI0011780C62|nr:DUF6382 domain-containing protein [Clostridium sp. HBUAS56017]
MIEKSDILLQQEIMGNKKYCFFKVKSDEKVIDFEISMLENNPSLAFLNIEVRQINDSKTIAFPIENKINLNEYLKQSEFDIREMLEITEGIFNSIVSMKEYMLDNKKIILNSKSIFLEKNNLLAYMIYIPLQVTGDIDIRDEFRELCKEILKEAKKYKYELNSSEKKLVSALTSSRNSFEKLESLFNEYKNSKEDIFQEELDSDEIEGLDEDLDDDFIKKLVETVEETPALNDKRKKITYQSIIDEDYKEFDDFDDDDLEEDDEDVEYQEYKEIKKYQKTLEDNNKTKRLLSLQLIVLMIIGSFCLILSKDDKKIFMIIAGVMIVLAILFTYIMFNNDSRKGK